MSISIGAFVSSLSVTFSKSAAVGGMSRASPQSPPRSAAVRRPPSRCARKFASEKEAWVWPMPVYHARPPSKSEHHAIGWSSSTVLPSCSSYVASSTVARTFTCRARGL